MERKITYYRTNEVMPNNGKRKIIGVYDDSDFKYFNPRVELISIATEEEYNLQEEEFKNSEYLKQDCKSYYSRETWESIYPNDDYDDDRFIEPFTTLIEDLTFK